MGWLLLGVAGFLLLSGDASAYVVLDYRMHTGSLPIGAVGLLLTLSWVPALMLLGLTILIFPSGQLPSRRWRWVVGIGGVAGLLYVLGASVVTVIVVSHHDVSVTSFGELTQVQQAGPLDRWWRILNGPCLVLLVVSLLAVLVHQVSAYRRSSGELRLQENWFLTGAAVTVIAAVSVVLLSNASGIWAYVHDVLPVLFAALPIGLGVGILKYRLYDIDRLISRTLSYAIVTGVVVGLYVGIITLVTRVLGFSSPIAVAASTLAAVAVFNPLRVRVQHIVDRRFNRARYDAEATIAGFTARLRGAVDLETVRSELLEVVNRAVEPAHASVWIRQHKSD